MKKKKIILRFYSQFKNHKHVQKLQTSPFTVIKSKTLCICTHNIFVVIKQEKIRKIANYFYLKIQ